MPSPIFSHSNLIFLSLSLSLPSPFDAGVRGVNAFNVGWGAGHLLFLTLLVFILTLPGAQLVQ
jgi:hypothetical protein